MGFLILRRKILNLELVCERNFSDLREPVERIFAYFFQLRPFCENNFAELAALTERAAFNLLHARRYLNRADAALREGCGADGFRAVQEESVL